MKYGILSPSHGEIAAFLEKLEHKRERNVAMMRLIGGEWNGHALTVGISGICKVNAALCAAMMIEREKIDALIVCGVAGAIDPTLVIGDTVVCVATAYHDVNNDFLAVNTDPPYLTGDWMPSDRTLIDSAKAGCGNFCAGHRVLYGKGVTGEAFIAEEGRETIINRYDPLCTDMETAAAAHVARCYGIPFIALRSITDTPHKSGMATFHENFLASSAVAQTCLEALLGELYR